ncbi:MAG: hypothetical protein ACRBBT_12530 [Paracoccaceae bacterium]
MPSISAETIIRTRQLALAVTGLTCVLYAALALSTGQPDPLPFWLPGGVGIAAGIVITLSFVFAGRRPSRAAKDELYRRESALAQRIGYWTALALYPIFGLALAAGWVSFPVAFAAMGTLTGAAYLLPFVALNLWG